MEEKISEKEKQVKRITISRATPGMMLARDIYSRTNQVILSAGAILDAQKIAKLVFFSIDTIAVYEPEENQEEEITLTQQIKNSVEFREFTKKYDTTVSTLKNSVNMLLTDGKEIDADALVEKIDRMVVEAGNKNRVFNMLHCIRDYDEQTYVHSVNVALICNCFAKWLNMNEPDTRLLTLAGMLHDVGKTTIPKEILLKPESLTEEEYEVVKTHSLKGYNMLKNQKVDDHIKIAALQHHERADGSGYPYGKTADEIDSFSMIVAIADVYDAMTSDRIYRPRICPFAVIENFEKTENERYDPKFLIPLLEQITEVYMNHTVRLSDQSVGKVVLMNKSELSKPIIQVGDIFVDLSRNRDLTITEVM